MAPNDLMQRLQASAGQFEEDLKEWLRIPSISSDPARIQETHAAGQWVAEKLRGGGLAVEMIETAGHPLIFASTPPVPGAPIALVYGHYDVQPVEPLDQWISGPFDPQVRDGNIYARGATDDKGQVLTHIESVLAWLATGEPLPIQIKFLIEGEEEVGSANLENLLASMAEQLACDVVVISDSSQYAAGQPAITYGLRGIATFQVRIDGPKQDLHSGSFGGAVTNPAISLCQMISAAIDANGQVRIPGFYDACRPLSDLERGQLAELPGTDAEFAASIGVPALGGDQRFTALERRWSRPTFEVNGLTSGHQGDGVKTIVPATASAKISFRLVPDQDPQQISDAFEAFFNQVLPAGVRLTFTRDHAAPGMLSRLDSPFMTAASQAIEQAFGTAPVMIREGGSIPIVTQFQQVLDADCLLLGWGLNDDNAHSPNEKFCLADFHKGIAASACLWAEIGKVSKSS
ncbi:dipeptidase [Planctomycetaceae bacterium SH139]